MNIVRSDLELLGPIFSDDDVRIITADIQGAIAQIKALIRVAVSEKVSPAGLARRAGLHRNALYGCDAPDWNPKSDTLEKLEAILRNCEAGKP